MRLRTGGPRELQTGRPIGAPSLVSRQCCTFAVAGAAGRTSQTGQPIDSGQDTSSTADRAGSSLSVTSIPHTTIDLEGGGKLGPRTCAGDNEAQT